MQAVRNYFGHFAKLDTWLKVGFQKSEITVDIPEDGVITREGWKITPMTYPAVSLYFTCRSCLCMNTFMSILQCKKSFCFERI